jgi:hypothetical protein
MIPWRLAIPAVLTAAAVAGCITYFVIPVPPPVEPVRQTELPPAPRPPKPNWETHDVQATNAVEELGAKGKAVTDFERAAENILRRAASARAFAEERHIPEPVPLPRKRPIPR